MTAETQFEEIRIERGGTVKGSFLAAGTVVDGFVEDSVLFPGVSVQRGAVVYQSIVMSGNCIGSKAQVSRTLVLPNFAEFYADFETELPYLTSQLIAFSLFMRRNIVIWPLLAAH